jgi:hypothetical protein
MFYRQDAKTPRKPIGVFFESQRLFVQQLFFKKGFKYFDLLGVLASWRLNFGVSVG